MSKIVKYEQFKNVVNGLWNKVKSNFISEILFDVSNDTSTNKPKNTLKFTKNGNSNNEIINHVVTKWEDLNYITKNEHPNLLNYESRIEGKIYSETGTSSTPTDNPEWSIVCIDIEPNETYSIFRKQDDNNRYFFLNEDNVYLNQSNGSSFIDDNGWKKSTVRNNVTGAKKLVIQFKHAENTSQDIMAFKGDYSLTSPDFIPYIGKTILINSRDVSLTYSSDNSSISSKTIHEAIDELSIKSVKEWCDLKYTSEYKYVNLLDISKRENGKYYDNAVNGKIATDSSWSIVKIPVKSGVSYTLLRTTSTDNAWKRVAYISEDGTITSVVEINPTTVGRYKKIIIPNIPHDCVKIGLSLHSSDINNLNCMVIEGDINYIDKYIPYKNGISKVFIEKDISLKFDINNTNFSSDFLDEAVKEIPIDYISRYKENFINEKTILVDGYTTSKLYTLNNNNAKNSMGSMSIFSSKEMLIPQGKKLSKVIIGVSSNYKIGDIVTDIKVGIARPDGQVQEYIVNNGTAVVHTAPISLGCQRAITVNIDRVWNDQNKILIVGGNGVLWGSRVSSGSGSTLVGGDTAAGDYVAPGNNLTYASNDGRWNGKVIMYGDEVEIGSNTISVNTKIPDSTGNISIDAMDLNAVVGGNTKNIQQHLQDINNNVTNLNGNINSCDNRIRTLEQKHEFKIGDIISTFANNGEEYTMNGVTYKYCGTKKIVSRSTYPDLANVLGIPSGVNNFELPVIGDISIRFDNNAYTVNRKHYIVAKIR